MPVPPGASNIRFGQRPRPTLNLNMSPGGQLVPYHSPANPNLKPFAEPPPRLNLQPPLQPPIQQPLPNLAELPKPNHSPLKPSVPSAGAAAGAGVAVSAGGIAGGFTATNLGLLAILLWASNAAQLYKLWNLSQPESKPELTNLRGGQDPDKYYVISGQYTEVMSQHEDLRDGVEITWKFDKDGGSGNIGYGGGNLKGVVELLTKVDGQMYGGHFTGGLAFKTGEFPSVSVGTSRKEPASANPNQPFGKITSIDVVAVPAPGQPEEELEPLPQLQRQASPQKQITRDPLPDFAEPEPPKPKLQIIPNLRPTPEKQPIRLRIPNNQPITITAPGQPPVRIAQPQPTTNTDTPTEIVIPRGGIPGQPQPIQLQPPVGQPYTFTAPGDNPITISIPGYEPIVIDPRNSGTPENTITNPLQPRIFTPTPSTPNTPFVPTPLQSNPLVPTPTPSPQPQPSPTPTPITPTPTNPNDPFNLEELKTRLDEQALLLTGITTLLNPISRNTTPEKIKQNICETAQPGNCMANAMDKAVDTGNKNLLDKLSKIFDALNLGVGADTNLRVRAIQQDTQKIRQGTGSDAYPLILPEYLLDDHIDTPVVIQNQVAYNVWLLKQIDALVGLFPIKIERTDENGNKAMLVFENIAEAIAEITGLLAEIAFDADTSVNVGVHATSEAIGAKIAAIQGNSYLKSIVDYLGFQGSHKSINVPISCTPGAVGADDKLQENELGDFLKSSTQTAIGWECTERDDLHSILKRILFDAEIARAALYKPIKPPKPNTPQSMTGDTIKADRRKEKERENKEWEEFKTRIKNQEGTGIDIDLNERPLDDGGDT